jgi:hypothetical protein
MQRPHHTNLAIGGLLAVVLALGGCASLTRPAVSPPEPPLTLLSAGPLELPTDCEPADGRVYRTNFIVEIDGRVTGARSESGEGCVQQALRTWVSSFRYAPVGAAKPTVIDWLAVTASRGG